MHCPFSPLLTDWGLRAYTDHDLEIGREDTLQQWVSNLVECAREWKRCLHSTGTLWVNIGNAYSGDKNLLDLPWELASALSKDGWYRRCDIVWAKGVDWTNTEREAQNIIKQSLAQVRTEAAGSLFGLSKELDRSLKRAEKAVDRLVQSGSVMPESVKDRPTSSYEMIFMFSKEKKYFFDQEAVRVLTHPDSIARALRGVSNNHKMINGAPGQTPHTMGQAREHGNGYPIGTSRNPRNVWVWRVGTSPSGTYILADETEVAHFAAFPVGLAERIIKAGTSQYGCCGVKKKKLRLRKGLTTKELTLVTDRLQKLGLVEQNDSSH